MSPHRPRPFLFPFPGPVPFSFPVPVPGRLRSPGSAASARFPSLGPSRLHCQRRRRRRLSRAPASAQGLSPLHKAAPGERGSCRCRVPSVLRARRWAGHGAGDVAAALCAVPAAARGLAGQQGALALGSKPCAPPDALLKRSPAASLKKASQVKRKKNN